MVFGLLVAAALVIAALTCQGWGRLFAFATLPILIGFGSAASVAMSGIEENNTPWAGGFERINAYAYFAWLVVLAVTLMRHEPRDPRLLLE